MSQSNLFAAFLTFAILSAPYFYAVVMHNGEAEYVMDSYFTAVDMVMVVSFIVGGTYFCIKEFLECFTSNNKK